MELEDKEATPITTCPFVTPIVGYFYDADRSRSFCTLDWLKSARSLQSVLKRRIRLELPTAQFVIAEIILAMEYLHSHHVYYKYASF